MVKFIAHAITCLQQHSVTLPRFLYLSLHCLALCPLFSIQYKIVWFSKIGIIE